MQHRITIPVLLAAGMLAACGGDSGSPTALPVPVASVTVAPETATIVVRAVIPLTATLKDAAGNTLTGRTVTWSSGNIAVATVSTSGLVTGVGGGLATITATSEEQKGTAAINVAVLTFQSLSAGRSHTCGVTTEGAAYCWGGNGDGQLGNGSTTNKNMPAAVSGGLMFTSVRAGGFHTCGVTTDGAAYCWGWNGWGQLGNGSGDLIPHSTPEAVSGGLTFPSMSTGGFHTCGVTTGAAAYCWGRNEDGQLGLSDVLSRAQPEAVSGGVTFPLVSTGAFHTCGVTTDGAAYCWGQNRGGQLGNDSFDSDPHLTPGPVLGELTFELVSTGLSHTCGVTTDGAAYCWGANDNGELGNGSADMLHHTTPEAVSGGLTFQSLSTQFIHTCGLTIGGEAYCWGGNFAGQLGDGSATDRTSPVLVFGQQ